MNKFSLSLAAMSLLGAAASAQVNVTYDFTAGAQGWTGTGYNPGWFSGATACGGAGGAYRTNAWTGNQTVTAASPLTGASTGGSTTVAFDYKIHNWSANTVPTPGNWGQVDLEYSDNAAGPWTVAGTWANEAQTAGVCLNRVAAPFSPLAGPLYIRFRGTWTSGDWWMNIDNVVISEVPSGTCSGTPAPGNTVGAPAAPICAGEPFTLSLQNATPGGGVTYQWKSSTISNAGPWTNLGTANTQLTFVTATTWYTCDVTCSAGPSTGSSSVVQVDVDPAATNPQDWETGITGCWSNSGGSQMPAIAPVSGFGIGTGAMKWDFWTWTAGNTGIVTSPVLTPTAVGDRAFFDVAGAQWSGNLAWIDQITLEESSDYGATWNTVVVMDNSATGVLRTAAPGGAFTPTASQWKNLSYALTPGTNRIRFNGLSGYGSNCYVDNIVVGPFGYAGHYPFGTSCSELPTLTMSAAPAPLVNSTFTWTVNGMPEYIPTTGLYFAALALGLGADVPGTSLATLTAGQLNSPCLVHVSIFAPWDVVLLSGGPTNNAQTFTIPNVLSLAGAELISQTIGAQDTGSNVCSNPACLFTSNAIRSYIGTF